MTITNRDTNNNVNDNYNSNNCNNDNSNKRVLITGSSKGIGKAIALYLAKEGYALALHYNSSKDKAKETLDEVLALNAKASMLSFDISNREETFTALTNDIEKNSVYYGVICNAGIALDNPFPILEEEEWDKVLRTNLDGFYNVLKSLVMPMVQRRTQGRIITISSISGLIGNRGQVNYSASKAGIIGATKALAVELAKHKITVNCIAPGVIDTEMTKDFNVDEIKKAIPMRRMGTGKEVASLVSYLLSENASYITRQVISVNGGII
ncbi:MAG: 3-oxoacyl-ACP reductase FabG [Bdellovibrionota bacterium]